MASRGGIVLEFPSRMINHMVVDELNVAGLEHHFEIDIWIGNDGIQVIQCGSLLLGLGSGAGFFAREVDG